jgi:hypothetical protein
MTPTPNAELPDEMIGSVWIDTDGNTIILERLAKTHHEELCWYGLSMKTNDHDYWYKSQLQKHIGYTRALAEKGDRAELLACIRDLNNDIEKVFGPVLGPGQAKHGAIIEEAKNAK